MTPTLEKSLHNSEKRSPKVIFKMANGFSLNEILFDNHQKPFDSRFLVVNSAFEKMTGLNKNKLIGKSARDIFPGSELFWIDKCGQVARTGTPFQNNNISKIYDRYFETIAYRPEKAQVAIVFTDITERISELRDLAKKLEENQKKLLSQKLDLEKTSKELIQTNTALSVLARNIDKKKDAVEKKIAHAISSKILPLIDDIKNDKMQEKTKAKLEVLSAYLNHLTPEVAGSYDITVFLSPMELKVAMMIKNGFSSNDIARLLHISPHTVKTHRRNIRKKLEIKNMDTDLASYLKLKL